MFEPETSKTANDFSILIAVSEVSNNNKTGQNCDNTTPIRVEKENITQTEQSDLEIKESNLFLSEGFTKLPVEIPELIRKKSSPKQRVEPAFQHFPNGNVISNENIESQINATTPPFNRVDLPINTKNYPGFIQTIWVLIIYVLTGCTCCVTFSAWIILYIKVLLEQDHCSGECEIETRQKCIEKCMKPFPNQDPETWMKNIEIFIIMGIVACLMCCIGVLAQPHKHGQNSRIILFNFLSFCVSILGIVAAALNRNEPCIEAIGYLQIITLILNMASFIQVYKRKLRTN